jgi:hypothetical protein
MAYIVLTKRGAFEVRESRSTDKGPRSRTLASFRQLDDEVVRKVRERAAKPPEPEELRQAAIRAGAPLSVEPADRAAGELLRLLATGKSVDPKLRTLLLDALEREERRAGGSRKRSRAAVSDAARAASQWIGASLELRGEALGELLGLADALPFEPRSEELDFPRLRST